MALKINKVIRVLILSDIALLSGIGFYSPIFAIFLTDRIQGGNVAVAGYAAAIYWIVQSLVIIPFGKYLDKNHGEKDDLWFIVIGNSLTALAVFGYLFASLSWHIYLLEAIFSIGMSMNIPAFTALFTRHIDKDKVAFDWSVRAALIGMGSGVAGAVGGVVANNFGFNTLFVGVIAFILFSAFLPFLISKQMSPRNGQAIRVPEVKTSQPLSPKE